MTPEENQALRQLLSQLVQIRGIDKDPEAERMIAQAVAQQPDAAYLLVQRTMILEQALNGAKEQINQLQSQNRHGTPSTAGRSFLDANSWGNHASTSASANTHRAVETSVTGRPLNNSGNPQWNGVGTGMQPGMGAMPGRRSSFLGGGGSMLGTMAATAAGVAGGAFLFHGIGNLLGNQNHGDGQGLADKVSANENSGNELNNNETAGSQDLSLADDGAAAAADDSMLSDSSGFDSGGFDGDSYEA
ncbi:DUF2076 domain-containing protein [Noviherbaspirillum aerium]|uniref:DUF2076 domain-containing protein n=1 Tax=Noviherbaspirillum aerium TaxID=2588497 RepID=UPI00178C1C2C|nr:DUF2076 domain-containing protein [Noviherbaspirillum aerium]